VGQQAGRSGGNSCSGLETEFSSPGNCFALKLN
jgi:hypothetical protein